MRRALTRVSRLQGTSAVEWQPVKQALTRRLAVCPTCSGKRIQRCLNCTGTGVVPKMVATVVPAS